MKHLIKTVLFSLTMVVPCAIQADVPTEKTELSQKKAINMIMEYSGLDEQIPQISQGIVSSFTQFQERIPQEVKGKFYNIILLSFDENDMYQVVRKEVEKNVSLNEAKDMLPWYKSVIGMEITDIEKSSGHNPSERQMMMEQKEELFSNKNRLELIEKIDKQYHGTEFALDVQIAVMRSSLKTMKSEIPEKKLEEYLSEMREKMKPSMHEMSLLSMLYSYKDIEEDDLRKYINFLEKTTTQSFLKSVNKGMLDAIILSTDKMMSEMLKLKQEV